MINDLCLVLQNMLRVIKTWMDEYEKFYYIREPAAKHRSPGDISSQIELRNRLQCRSFKWCCLLSKLFL